VSKGKVRRQGWLFWPAERIGEHRDFSGRNEDRGVSLVSSSDRTLLRTPDALWRSSIPSASPGSSSDALPSPLGHLATPP
jgi:hypothetical protein